ncbi:MAG: thymidine phosphorylase [Defluviitaleaceae bacterium]|nr:thymidine phosphorylase [Defluviitaleaceae bacterium]MCL2263973.1 thymidine phosphorylase [Defluviitaleaceae bacterium]
MRIYEVITKKKRGEALTATEIRNVIEGFTHGEIADYHMAALLMAVYFRGMNAEETAALTMAMVESGEYVDLKPLKHTEKTITVDKHSTGGVGDKTTLAVVPIVAACGVPIAKMSGRGLGHTGGTIDKLEAIPGFNTKLSGAEFMGIVKKIGLCVAGQSANLAPADKRLYALRDVTATVDSIPLIAASIMSKKIAAGADAILLDVKTGSGAFMKSLEDARALAQIMVETGNNCGRKTAAIITDMSAPLGSAIGNSLELIEVIQLLKGERISQNLLQLCEELAANMLFLAEKGELKECRVLAKEAITSGGALQKLADMVEAQGGNRSYIESPAQFPQAKTVAEITAPHSGYITETDTEGIGIAAMILGAGRTRPEDEIDYSAGIVLNFGINDYVEKGQVLARFHTNSQPLISEASEKFLQSLTFSNSPAKPLPLIHERIGL